MSLTRRGVSARRCLVGTAFATALGGGGHHSLGGQVRCILPGCLGYLPRWWSPGARSGPPLVDSPAAELFAELGRRGTVLYLHPAGNAACTPLIADHHGTWSVGAPVEDTISALHLITHGIPSRYPRMKILNSHPAAHCRCSCSGWTTNSPGKHPKPPETPSVAARWMWYDTVGPGHLPALRCAADSLGASHLVLGTDFPYQNGAAYQSAIGYLTTSGLPPGEADRVLSANAQALLGLTAPGGATSSGPVPAAS
jgi:predicted TIM-barrel fold metal-dependent hydrolase